MKHSLAREFELVRLRETITKLQDADQLRAVAVALLELNFSMKTTVDEETGQVLYTGDLILSLVPALAFAIVVLRCLMFL